MIVGQSVSTLYYLGSMVNLHHSEKDIGLKQVTPSLWITIHKFLKVNSITMIKHIFINFLEA